MNARTLHILSAAAVLAGLAQASAFAQVSTRTNRVGERTNLNPPTEGKAVISDTPRYYLDTQDVLERKTGDLTRTAPGLAKNNYVGKTFLIKNTRAIEIQTYLLRMLAYEGGTCEVMGLGGVDADGPAAQMIFCTMPDFMEPYVEEMVAKCDVAGFKYYDATGRDNGKGVTGATKYVGKHRTASELINILKGTELGNIGVFFYPPFGDDSTNSIYVVDNPTDVADDMAALEMFDVPPLQVELHCMIYEVENGDDSDLGPDWSAWKRSLSGSGSFNYARDLIGDVDTVKDVSTALTLDATVLADFLNYLVGTTKAHVMTDTYVSMVNSEDVGGIGGARGASTQAPAIIKSTTTIPYQVKDTIGTATEGVTLNVLPFIGTESITLQLSMEVASLIGYAQDGVPLISSRNASSVVNLVNGQTFVLGGIEKVTNSKTTLGIPFLKDIPVLKYVFGNEVKRKSTGTIIAVLKPVIKDAKSVDEAAAHPIIKDMPLTTPAP